MDFGLILSIVAAIAATDLLAAHRPLRTASASPLDLALWPAVVGVIAGRLAAMVIERGSSLGDLRDLFILRGGVELVPGVVVGVGMFALSARRAGVGAVARLGDLAPYGMAALAGYQATCVVREGCFGPSAPFGLPIGGTGERVVPVEVIGALALGVIAVWLVAVRDRRSPGWSVACVVAVVALQRSLVSIWLPAVGDGLSRPHVTSIAVAVVAVPVLVLLSVRRPAPTRILSERAV